MRKRRFPGDLPVLLQIPVLQTDLVGSHIISPRFLPFPDRLFKGFPALAVTLLGLCRKQHAAGTPGQILRHQAPGGAGGVAVLIVKPGIHPPLFPLLHGIPDKIKEFLAQVRNLKSRSGMEVIAAKAHLVKDGNLPRGLLLRKFSV